jgi:hypothetical protein
VKYILALICLLTAPAFAGYAPEEIYLIKWGTSPTNLKSIESSNEYVFQGGENYSRFRWPGIGPTQIFLDKAENIFINSSTYPYFKSFKPNGSLLMDLSPEIIGNINDYYTSQIEHFYLDSLDYLYFASYPPKPYIIKLDTLGIIVGHLSPFDSTLGIPAENISYSLNDVLGITFGDSGIFMYERGQFYRNGSSAWKGIDNRFYGAHMRGFQQLSTQLVIYSGINPVNDKLTSEMESEILLGDSAYSAHLRATDIQGNLFITLGLKAKYSKLIELNNNNKIIDSIIFPPIDTTYFMGIPPFISPNGNIYEFRYLDDGLHVIRWSRK